MKRIFSLLLAFVLLSCSDTQNVFAQEGRPPSNQAWTTLLQKHVNNEGLVNYQAFQKDSVALNDYTALLSNNPPAENWTDEEKIAYWINAYNAFTVKLIVDNYPLKSIKDLNPTISIPTVRSIWTKEWFQIGREDFSLDKIEHKILRKEFEEPRIHFAVNCASISCPVLRAEAFEAEKLNEQLDEQARIFLNDPTRNQITADKPRVSKIFFWFGGDFKKGQSVTEFINQYSETQISYNAKLKYLDYDWRLNVCCK